GKRLPDVRAEGAALAAGHRRRWRAYHRPRSLGRGGTARDPRRRRRDPHSARRVHAHGAIRQAASRGRHPRKETGRMTWVILTGRQSDIDPFATPHKIITTRDYLAHPSLFRGARPKVINLSNNFGYQSRGYYASLLAGSRGHKVIPTVETMIDLSEKKLYENALPELELALNKCRKDLGGAIPGRATVFFGIGPSKAWDRFARLVFDWFRAPALEVTIKDAGEWASIRKIGFLPLARMK